ncbi:MAG TPA: hypothetical protein VJZ00_18830, partial [Thermoanaerobaculia bacterium]|nr:hypothetical protein [Thermoanaerobaculia bacterium]
MKSRSSGRGCLFAIALPFAAAGIYLAFLAVRLSSLAEKRLAFMFGCGAIVFGGAGLAMIAAALRGSRSRERREEEWATRRIRAHSAAGTAALWGFALLWNAIAASVLLFVPHERTRVFWIAFLFPVIGIALLGVAIHAMLRVLRFRESTFVADALPAPIGGVLRGMVEVPHPLTDVSAIMLRLNCVTRERNGNETSFITTCHEEREVDPAAVRMTMDGVAIPVEIPIPADAPASDDDRTWKLVVDAEVPGVDYSASFDVPVEPVAFTDFRPHATTPLGPPRNPRSLVEREGPHGHELHFPAFRARSVAFWSLFATLFVAGATLFAIELEAPAFMVAIVGLIGLVFLASTLDLFFASRTVILAPDHLIARRRLLFASTKSIPYGEIA